MLKIDIARSPFPFSYFRQFGYFMHTIPLSLCWQTEVLSCLQAFPVTKSFSLKIINLYRPAPWHWNLFCNKTKKIPFFTSSPEKRHLSLFKVSPFPSLICPIFLICISSILNKIKILSVGCQIFSC